MGTHHTSMCFIAQLEIQQRYKCLCLMYVTWHSCLSYTPSVQLHRQILQHRHALHKGPPFPDMIVLRRLTQCLLYWKRTAIKKIRIISMNFVWLSVLLREICKGHDGGTIFLCIVCWNKYFHFIHGPLYDIFDHLIKLHSSTIEN